MKVYRQEQRKDGREKWDEGIEDTSVNVIINNIFEMIERHHTITDEEFSELEKELVGTRQCRYDTTTYRITVREE